MVIIISLNKLNISIISEFFKAKPFFVSCSRQSFFSRYKKKREMNKFCYLFSSLAMQWLLVSFIWVVDIEPKKHRHHSMELKTWQFLQLLHVQFLQLFNLQDCKPPGQLTTPFLSKILNMKGSIWRVAYCSFICSHKNIE